MPEAPPPGKAIAPGRVDMTRPRYKKRLDRCHRGVHNDIILTSEWCRNGVQGDTKMMAESLMLAIPSNNESIRDILGQEIRSRRS